MRFASRAEFGSNPSEFGMALQKARSSATLLDLATANPTLCGFEYPVDQLLKAMNNPAVLRYEADALGMREARQALSVFYRDVYGADLAPDRLLLTASTSEAYSYLLRLFCEPGDAILVPSPSYPLFDLLAQMHDVEVLTYALVYHDGWQIDPSSLASAVTARTRAVVAIHPNNPTGHYCSPADQEALYALVRTHDLPLIVDEVFLDYGVESHRHGSFAATQRRGGLAVDAPGSSAQGELAPLTFVLSGLSKLLALPQMKLAWMAVCGPDEQARAALTRLEVIADTFLSVGTPPQVALPMWLAERKRMQIPIQQRVLGNLRLLDQAIEGTAISRLKVEGGWSAVLRVPSSESDTHIALHLLQQHGVVVHPGSLYGFGSRGWLVVSLLSQPEVFLEGVKRLTRIEFGTPFPHVGAGL